MGKWNMTTYSTRNRLGSTAVKDLYDNAENLDTLVNDKTKETHPDRFGVERKTWHGMEQDFQRFLINSGYQHIGNYEAGLNITARNQIFWREGELYRAGASLELPYTTTGNWTIEGGLFVALGDTASKSVISIECIEDLKLLPESFLRSDLRYLVKGYYRGSAVGGKNHSETHRPRVASIMQETLSTIQQ